MTDTKPESTTDAPAAIPGYQEVVTHFLPQDVQLPGGAGTMVLITMDNGFDHTKPNSFGLAGMAEYQSVLNAVQQRVAAGAVQAVEMCIRDRLEGVHRRGRQRGRGRRHTGVHPGNLCLLYTSRCV